MPDADLFATPLQPLADQIGKRLRARKIKLTLGGEPTYVPDDPEGAEWNVAAVGPTKLDYAYKLAAQLVARFLPGAVTVFSPGKRYPGEINPRWVVNLLANRDGTPIAPPGPANAAPPASPARVLDALRAGISKALHVKAANWLPARDPADRTRRVFVLPLDHDGQRWFSQRWPLPDRRKSLLLVNAEGPAGLRLPLSELPPEAMRRALTLETRADGLHVFLPPLLQAPCREILALFTGLLSKHRAGPYFFEGYLPWDEANVWTRVGLTADPGVLEVNIPPCETWHDYHRWLVSLEDAARACGLRSWKEIQPGRPGGTGGGNHLLFGGPSVDENPFFTRPAWVASLLRYFQAHPSLAYLFTGQYVGPSSQAPRPDESARDLYDLDLGYQYLAGLPKGDHRYILGETLRHLHTDISGNTHRSEISFDKFWDLNGPPSAASGLIEFRAIESLPDAHSMSLIALLWSAIAVHTLEHPTSTPLVAHGNHLHDRFFLPSSLWADLQTILADLQGSGLDLPTEGFRKIWNWRFPLLLDHPLKGGTALEIRRACEGWPLLSETPSEGGTTSRFVDTSIERLEITAKDFADQYRLFVNGRELPSASCGLRYRRTALFPSLHPGIKPQMPLEIVVTTKNPSKIVSCFRLEADHQRFEPAQKKDLHHALDPKRPAIKSDPSLLTYDLRLG